MQSSRQSGRLLPLPSFSPSPASRKAAPFLYFANSKQERATAIWGFVRGGDMAVAVIARRGCRAMNNQFRDINWRARRLLSGIDQSEGGERKEMQDVEFSAFESEMKSLQRHFEKLRNDLKVDFEKLRNDLKVDFEKIESKFKMDREFRRKIDNASFSDQLNRSNNIRHVCDEFEEKQLAKINDHTNKHDQDYTGLLFQFAGDENKVLKYYVAGLMLFK